MESLGNSREFVLGDLNVPLLEIFPALERVINDLGGIIGVRQMVSNLRVVVLVKSVQNEGCNVEGSNFILFHRQIWI